MYIYVYIYDIEIFSPNKKDKKHSCVCTQLDGFKYY